MSVSEKRDFGWIASSFHFIAILAMTVYNMFH